MPLPYRVRWIGRKCNLIGSAAGRPEADPYRRTVGHRFVGGGLPDAPDVSRRASTARPYIDTRNFRTLM